MPEVTHSPEVLHNKNKTYQEIVSESKLYIPFSVVVGISPTFLLSIDISSLLGSVIMISCQTSLLASVQVKNDTI